MARCIFEVAVGREVPVRNNRCTLSCVFCEHGGVVQLDGDEVVDCRPVVLVEDNDFMFETYFGFVVSEHRVSLN